MKFERLLAVMAACVLLAVNGVAHAVHVPVTVNSAANVSYFDNAVSPQIFTGDASQNSGLAATALSQQTADASFSQVER